MAYIEWKGIKSNTIPGLMICELPPISKPKMKTSITKIGVFLSLSFAFQEYT